MRLLSYNIHKGIGGRDRLYRLERILDVIRAEQPDILCLQEVDRNVKRSAFDNQPELLARELGFEHSTFQLNHRVGEGGYGNLILSRWAINKRHNVSLRHKGRKNRRGQIVLLETDQGPLRLVNWHLGLGEKERHWQVRKLLNHERYDDYSHAATILAGDTNDWRNTLQKGPVAEHELIHASAPPSRFRTFPAYMPVGALDKYFHCKRVKVERVHAVRNALSRKASDHLPLVLDFSLV